MVQLKIEIKQTIQTIQTYDRQTHDRNIANDGNETNQTNSTNVSTNWTKCLHLLNQNVGSKIWMLENQFYLCWCWLSVKIAYSTWFCNLSAPRFSRLLSQNFNSNENTVKNFKRVHSCFIINFLYGVFILSSSESKSIFRDFLIRSWMHM